MNNSDDDKVYQGAECRRRDALGGGDLDLSHIRSKQHKTPNNELVYSAKDRTRSHHLHSPEFRCLFLCATGQQRLKEIKKSSSKSQVELMKMDVTKLEDVISARKVIQDTVGENGLTLLINNAGVAKHQPFPNLTEENMLMHFTINTMGPIRVLQEMLPLLQKAANNNSSPGGLRVSRAAALNLTSMVGSITRTGVELIEDLKSPSYKMSKAGLNMAMRVAAALVKEQGILVVLMCPGWVKTDMGTDRAPIAIEESISAMLDTLPKLNDDHHGAFMDRFGNPYVF